jgi:hypothetical protein
MTNHKKLAAIALAGVLALPLVGCQVEQTEEGEMPEITAEGGNLPEYDVDAAEVEIGTEPATVEVPTDIDVTTEEREISVPDVDVNPPADDDDEVDNP